MTYQEFVSAIVVKVKQQIKGNISVQIYTSIKNNGRERVGINLSEENINISPTIYLEEYYEQFQKNNSLDNIVENILELYHEVRFDHSWKTELIQDFSQIQKHIVYKLIHAEKNKETLRRCPHQLYLDLAVVFYILIDLNQSGTASILVTYDMVKLWNTDLETLNQIANSNIKALLPAELKTMRSVICELLEEPMIESVEDCMYVLTNHIRTFGAACILYQGVLEDIANQLNENFYVLPSSIHEVIIVPESKSPSRAELEEMILEINETQLSVEEILSNRPYFYSCKENRLIL